MNNGVTERSPSVRNLAKRFETTASTQSPPFRGRSPTPKKLNTSLKKFQGGGPTLPEPDQKSCYAERSGRRPERTSASLALSRTTKLSPETGFVTESAFVRRNGASVNETAPLEQHSYCSSPTHQSPASPHPNDEEAQQVENNRWGGGTAREGAKDESNHDIADRRKMLIDGLKTHLRQRTPITKEDPSDGDGNNRVQSDQERRHQTACGANVPSSSLLHVTSGEARQILLVEEDTATGESSAGSPLHEVESHLRQRTPIIKEDPSDGDGNDRVQSQQRRHQTAYGANVPSSSLLHVASGEARQILVEVDTATGDDESSAGSPLHEVALDDDIERKGGVESCTGIATPLPSPTGEDGSTDTSPRGRGMSAVTAELEKDDSLARDRIAESTPYVKAKAGIRNGSSQTCRMTKDAWSKARRLAQDYMGQAYARVARGLFLLPLIGREMCRFAINMKRGSILAMMSCFLAIVSALYPTTPKGNVALSAYAWHHTQQGEQSRKYYVLLGIVVLCSIVVDTDWLYFDYPDVFDDIDQDQDSATRFVAWYAVSLNVPLKMCMFICLARLTGTGRELLSDLWNRLHVFCPPTSRRLPKRVSDEVQSRLIAIAWIQLICSCTLLLLTLYVHKYLSWAPYFTLSPRRLDLKFLMFAKGITALITALALLKKIDLIQALAEFGCLFPCMSWYDSRKRLRRGKGGPKVVVNANFLKFNAGAKVVDFAVGISTWIVLAWAHKLGGRSKPKDVRLVLTITSLALILSDILVVVLGLTVLWYANMLKHKGKIEKAEESSSVARNYGTPSKSKDACSIEAGQPSPEDDSIDSDSDDSCQSSIYKRITPMSLGHGGSRADPIATDYDLSSSVRRSQDIFESRIREASPSDVLPLTAIRNEVRFQPDTTTATTGAAALELSQRVACDPQAFRLQWNALPNGTRITCKTTKTPLMRECHKHFEQQRFYVIASGVVGDGMMKLFLIAERIGKRCLVEVEFEPSSGDLDMHVKSDDAAMVPFFVQCLNLWFLFGDFV